MSTLQLADGNVKALDSYETECKIRGMNATDCFKLNEVLVVDRLPDIKESIPAQEDLAGNDHLCGIDIPVIENDDIDFFIGTGAPALHVFSEVRREGDTGLLAGNTPLGWVLFGHDNHQANVVNKSPEINSVSLIATQDLEVFSNAICPCQFEHVDIHRDTEECLLSLDDERALDIIQRSCELKNDHYSKSLPRRKGCSELPNNHSIALSRLRSLGRRLQREPETLELYKKKINEMIDAGNAYKITPNSKTDPRGGVWYIPHHCTGKKFRVVFDCAATCGGTSLNKQLLSGPDNTNTLIGVLLLFRLHAVALVGDIRNRFH